MSDLDTDLSLDDDDDLPATTAPVAAQPVPEVEEDLDLTDLLSGIPDKPVVRPTPKVYEDDGDDLGAFMASGGVQQEKTVSYKRRPWMNYHKFELVTTIERLREIVDEAIKRGECALDLETQGLDRRIYNRTRSELGLEDASEIDPDFWTKQWAYSGKAPATVHKIVGYCLSSDGITGYYIPIRHRAEESKNVPPGLAAVEIRRLCKAAQPVLTPEGYAEDPLGSRHIEKQGIQIYFWNAKFDQEFLYPITGIEYWHPESFIDGLLVYFSRYTGDKNLGLKWKAFSELKTEKGDPYEMIDLKELFVSSSGRKRDIDFPSLHPEEAYEYGASDSVCTFLLCKKKENQDILKDTKNVKHIAITQMTRLEKQVVQAVRGMERPRIMLNLDYVRALTAEAVTEAAGYEKEILAVAESVGIHNFDIRSSKQLSDFLFSDRGLNVEPKPEINEKSGQYKTDADSLEKLVDENPLTVNPVLKTIVKFRQIDKVVGTYLTSMTNNCDANDEMAYQFKQTGAATARFSAPAGQPEHGYSGVPMHGIPSTYDDKKPKVATSLRKAFQARPGFTMVKCDFAGEELRIATNVSKEPVWMEEFKHGSGDLHSITARAFFNKQEVSKQERQMGKMANFSLLYGGGAQAISRATGCSAIEGQRRKKNFDMALPQFAKWSRNQKALCHKEKGVWTAFRRWIAIPEIDAQDKYIVAGAERMSGNYPIQGTGADIMKIAMVLLHKEFYKRSWLPSQNDWARMLLTVHDEIVFEIKHEILQDAMKVIVDLMEKPGKMANWEIPLVAEPLIDLTWDAKYDWDLIMHGKNPKDIKKFKEDEHVMWEGKVYGRLPSWLVGHVKQPWDLVGQTVAAAPEPSSEPKGEALVPAPQALPAPQAQAAPQAASAPMAAPRPAPVPAAPTGEVKIFRISCLTPNSVKQMAIAITWSIRPKNKGVLLEVQYAGSGEVLVPASLGLYVDSDEFQRKLDEYNL